ncbi:MAG: hypothetical protein KDI14_02255 [Halioglobus sp.]|nr:hypothetical protein [Halioglobus sp.]
MATGDNGMTIDDNREPKLEITLINAGLLLIAEQKKARKTGYEMRANSHMLRGRNIGQGTCLHTRGGHALIKIVADSGKANFWGEIFAAARKEVPLSGF